VRRTTLGVFTFSAALAGFGGALYGMALQSAASTRFDFMSGVSILLAMVVAGIGSIGAAVFAGLFLGGPTLANLFPDWTQLTSMTIALAAVALARHPEGFIAHELRPRWEPVARSPRLLAAFLVGLVVVWALRVGDALDNWGWAVATLALLATLPLAAASLRHYQRRGGTMDDRHSEVRLARFRSDVDALRRPSPTDRHLLAGAALLVAGVGCAVVAFFVSHGTTSDLTQRDAVVLAIGGLTVAVAGTALYLRATIVAVAAPRRAVDAAPRTSGGSTADAHGPAPAESASEQSLVSL
jgi:hypothetical protein